MDVKILTKVIAEEMLADLTSWIDMAERWVDRYGQYGKQFGDGVFPPPGIPDSLLAELLVQRDRLTRLGEGFD